MRVAGIVAGASLLVRLAVSDPGLRGSPLGTRVGEVRSEEQNETTGTISPESFQEEGKDIGEVRVETSAGLDLHTQTEANSYGYWHARPLVAEEGHDLGGISPFFSVHQCSLRCEHTPGCQSFAVCQSGPSGCWMKDRYVTGRSRTNPDSYALQTRRCETYYKTPSYLGYYGRPLVADEGQNLGGITPLVSIHQCAQRCESTPGCQSFAVCQFSPSGCWMKDRYVTASSATTSDSLTLYTRNCETYYRTR